MSASSLLLPSSVVSLPTSCSLASQEDDTPLIDLSNRCAVEKLLADFHHPTDVLLAHAATVQIRRLLSIEVCSPIDEVLSLGVVPRLVEFLARSDQPRLQFEAAWALTNIASGNTDETAVILKAGALPRFIELLSSPHADLRDQCAWAIANIAGDGSEARDMCFQLGAMPALLAQFRNNDTPNYVVQKATWAVSNLCRGKPAPPLAAVDMAIPLLVQLVTHADEDIVTDAAWAISYITDDSDAHKRERIIRSGVVPRMVQLLGHENPVVRVPAVRTIGNIVSGTLLLQSNGENRLIGDRN